jgi:hypothetical protein
MDKRPDIVITYRNFRELCRSWLTGWMDADSDKDSKTIECPACRKRSTRKDIIKNHWVCVKEMFVDADENDLLDEDT